jgi:predicted dinucleotide-binding enzyme
MDTPRISIAMLGAGRVGTTLGRCFAESGHAVCYGVRNPDDPKHASVPGPVLSITDAAARADIVVLTTAWAGAEATLRAAGDLAGKVLVDATNPIGPGMVLTHGTTDSGAEQVSRWAPGARVVKAFNSIGMEVMANPRFGDARSVLWTCGDDVPACDAVSRLATDIGFGPVRLGPLARARFIEPAALVWITTSATMGREFAWGILRRTG